MRRAAMIFTWVAAAVVVGVVGYFMMDLHSLGSLGESNDSPSQAEVERLSGIRIPESAAQLQARVDVVITKRTLYLRFSLSQDELQSLLEQLQIESMSKAEIPRDLLSSDRPDWFMPERAKQFLAGEQRRRAVLIAIDESKVSRCTVYLKARR
jgi:hypothetical protein